MKIKQNLSINITPHYDSIYHEHGSEYGKITIDTFNEYFYISPQVWTMDQYQKQWKLALEKIETHDTSCFVTNYQTHTKMIMLWPIYKSKQEKRLCIQNQILCDYIYQKIVGNKKLTPQNIFTILPDLKAFNDAPDTRLPSRKNNEPDNESDKLLATLTPSKWYIDYED